jgi:hypothetical protein
VSLYHNSPSGKLLFMLTKKSKVMPRRLLFALILLILLSPKTHTQCTIPNHDFSGPWIHSLYINWSESYDPDSWHPTWITSYNAYNYFTPGIFPAVGTTSTLDAVEFNLEGVPNVVGIKSKEPILCSQIPKYVLGKFKHQGNSSDTLHFSMYLSTLDAFGDTIREVLTTPLIANSDVGPEYQDFSLGFSLPQHSGYSQIDSLVIEFKSVANNPGKFFLDEVRFKLASVDATIPSLSHLVQVNPTIVQGTFRVNIQEPIADWQVDIIAVDGRVVLTKQCGSSMDVDFEMSNFSNGMYFVQCKDSNGQVFCTKRVVKI